MNQNLKGKTAIVTGASRGLGRAIAEGLADAGARVGCVATKHENALPIVDTLRERGAEAEAFGCHVERGAEVERLFADADDRLGAIDILVNNAGISEPMATLDMTEENWDRHMDINCKSIFLCAQAAARRMKDNGGGVIVNIGSILGRNAFPATLGYCTSKAAVDHMTRVMAIEWARFGIRVNCVAPGYVRTELIEQLEREGKLDTRDLERRTPQRRLGTGADVAQAVRYVASEEAAFMTGETLVIDGVTVQEARAGDMIHNIPELIEYASSLITVFPGDVLQSGTSGGTGAGRVERATGSGYLQDGETITARIEGIGELHHRVVEEKSVPDDLSGAQLPPVRTYRRGGN